ncbi:MAG: adenosylhomocysteinase [Caldisericia bacterium]|nr:adenosylhomocysteinase [Caldisericia bacterium]
MSFESGNNKINWASSHMPILKKIDERFSVEKPLKNLTIAVCIHLEAKTARLAEVLHHGGASVLLTGSNTLTTQDDVSMAIEHRGVQTFAKYGCSEEEYTNSLDSMLKKNPSIFIDDGGDLTNRLHTHFKHLLPKVLGGCEETTTGVIRLKSRETNNRLHVPMISVNNALSKCLFDNRYGTGQSVWTAIMNTTNLIVAGKTVVVAGYGWCGKGVSMRAKALGAKVIITEIDPIKSMEAHMDGFSVMPMEKAAPIGDFFITVTGCKKVISTKHFSLIKNNAILCNAGHFNVEIDMEELHKVAVGKTVRKNIQEFTLPDNKKINVLAQGKLVNLASGDGHPVEIMDLSFALQALCVEYIKSAKLKPGLYNVPKSIDQKVAELKLQSLGISIDQLTPSQVEYLNAFEI